MESKIKTKQDKNNENKKWMNNIDNCNYNQS